MSAEKYFERANGIFENIRTRELAHIRQAASLAADSIAGGGLVHLFGSGHSVIPVLDVFPRYGSFAGFHPLLDARLMWTQVLGSGGVRELLKLERTEGYIKEFLSNFRFETSDTLIVYSHGGLNAAPVEAALYGRSAGMKVVAVTSVENARRARATHSSGKKLADLGDVIIDNCCPPEDALVEVAGALVAASSTLAVVAISMALVAETALQLAHRGVKVRPFLSPNVPGQNPDNNRQVFDEFVLKTAPRTR
jgi:uncharacterized phosphosugar-binding protein